MATWTNSDGLYIEYGPTKTQPALLGEYRLDGPQRLAELKFDYTRMPTVAQNSVVIERDLVLPEGAIIEKVEIFTAVDFDSSGDTMTLNLGTVDTDGTSNAVVDSLIVAATQTELNTGGTNVAGWVGTYVGGSPLTAPKLLTWEVDSQAATAGEASIRIYYSVP